MSGVAAFPDPNARLARLPVAIIKRRGVTILDEDGTLDVVALPEAAEILSQEAHLVCARSWGGRLLGLSLEHCPDILELFAFIWPARPLTPTVRGLAAALGDNIPADDEDEALYLKTAAQALLAAPLNQRYPHRTALESLAMMMAQGHWPWGTYVLGAAAQMKPDERRLFDVLPQWEGEPPPPPPAEVRLAPEDVVARLAHFLPQDAEDRPGQRDYARVTTHTFSPREHVDQPNVQVSEAGTGIGKTLGYAAGATAWAEQAGAPVWVATFTRALQRQVDEELAPFFLDKRGKVVVRKGRENYLCLLNLDEALGYARGGGGRAGDAALIGLIARWTLATKDGDLLGGDFPGWLAAQFGSSRAASLTDHRGECIYSACRHYRRCFIERSQRAAARADIVIANHAVVMISAARRMDVRTMPTRLIFDEAHHVFDAADSAFSAFLSGQEMADLRRWILGSEGKRRGRGLEARLGDLAYDSDDTREALNAVLSAAGVLPNEGWLARLRDGAHFGPAEAFLAACRAQVLARAKASRYDLECDVAPATDALLETSVKLDEALAELSQPFARLMQGLGERLTAETGDLDFDSRGRLEGAVRLLEYRVGAVLAWRSMLSAIGAPRPDDVVDWLSLERLGGRDIDVGLRRHALDPTEVFAKTVLEPAHGVLMTSATLRDKLPEAEDGDWSAADMRTGVQHLITPPRRFSVASPFDYGKNAQVFVVQNVNKNDNEAVANAYRQLFRAAGGGGLGLFTAIERLRRVHGTIFDDLLADGIDLYAQHVDPMDPATLVDIFREQAHSCLLGTDALRDGVDVPGDALRLLVLDRVPWPRPSILHRARRAAFGGRSYDDMTARFKLIQAFGRLIRKADDRGVFVLLDPAAPTRLFSGFPAEVSIQRMGLDETVEAVHTFLKS